MITVKTRGEVLDNARTIFETAPWLVDLVIALCDTNRGVLIKGIPGKTTGGLVEWEPEK